MNRVNVIGGGLAGVEAAWQAARAAAQVRLFEMRPVTQTPAHRTDKLAEIVCSNSLKSNEPGSAPYLLKEELRRAGSLVMDSAAATRVPAGAALAVDRHKFAELITEQIERNPNIELVREEVKNITADEITIIASGPLSSDALTAEIMKLTGSDQLYFYDALVAAESATVHDFDNTKFFEGCLPIEVMAHRGVDTLRFGPMKPVGLVDPRTGREPYAAVQLRQENLMADAYSLVGFQNHLRYGEQARVLRLIPGLERAEFLQFGQIHRNTYICSPRVLSPTMQMRDRPSIFFAGQITGVEGYVESVAMGWLAGQNAARLSSDRALIHAPRLSAMGALARYVSNAETKNFQPVNITFALLEPLAEQDRKRVRRKRDRHQLQVELALKEWDTWLQDIHDETPALQAFA